MPSVLLNDKSCRRPAPAAGRIELWDTNTAGFGLRVTASGERTFTVKGRLHGTQVRRTVGRFPPLHVTRDEKLRPGELWPAEARARAQKMLADMARGVDPAPPAAAATPGTPAASPRTFAQVAAAYLADPGKRGGGSLRSRGELERKVRVDLAAWADRPIESITQEDVLQLVEAKHATAPISANRLLALVRRVFGWAARRKLIPSNPAEYIDKPEDEEERERDRVLTLDELARVWRGAQVLGFPYGDLIKLLILTGQRRGEVGGMSRAEIDGTAWRLPDARAKRKKGHLVPLSPSAVKIIEALPQISGSPLLFTTGLRAAPKGGKVDPEAKPAPVSGWSRVKCRLDKIIAEQAAEAEEAERVLVRHYLPEWTLHDLRRSMGTHLRDGDVMGEDRVDRLVISKVLNHSEGGVTRLYDRYAADPEKRRALEAWALVVERISRT